MNRSPAERERQMIRAVQQAEWQRHMLHAGGIDPETLSEQARRILAWIADWDDWTVDGVTELLGAAHRAGHDAATTETEPAAHRRGDTAHGVDRVTTRLAALQRRPDIPEVGL